MLLSFSSPPVAHATLDASGVTAIALWLSFGLVLFVLGAAVVHVANRRFSSAAAERPVRVTERDSERVPATLVA